MTNIVAVSRDRHWGKSWRRPGGPVFAQRESVAPLVGVEFAKVALEMPIGFVQQAERWAPVALMSPIAGANFFVGPDGQWLGGYLPAALRAFPFCLLRLEGSNEAVLGVDEESGLVVDSDGAAELFFGPDGGPSPATKAVFDFLVAIERNRAITDGAVVSLRETGLIQPWALSAKFADRTTPLDGLFCIDEKALNALDDSDFLKLRKSGALQLAYLQLMSMGQIKAFERLNCVRQNALHNDIQFSLDEFFNNADSAILRFN